MEITIRQIFYNVNRLQFNQVSTDDGKIED